MTLRQANGMRLPQLEIVEEFGIEISREKALILHQLKVERYRGLYPFYHIFTKRPVHGIDGFMPRLCDGNELADHGVVIGRNDISRIHMTVNPYAVTAGLVKDGYPSW